VLCVVDDVAFEGRLSAVARILSASNGDAQPVLDRSSKLQLSLSPGMIERAFVKGSMPELVADQLLLLDLERVRDVIDIASLHAVPLDEFDTTRPARPTDMALLDTLLLQEAMQINVAL
jgi:hypothetical protein